MFDQFFLKLLFNKNVEDSSKFADIEIFFILIHPFLNGQNFLSFQEIFNNVRWIIKRNLSPRLLFRNNISFVVIAHEFHFWHCELFDKSLIKNQEHHHSQYLFRSEIADTDCRVEIVPVHQSITIEIEHFEDSELLTLRVTFQFRK